MTISGRDSERSGSDKALAERGKLPPGGYFVTRRHDGVVQDDGHGVSP